MTKDKNTVVVINEQDEISAKPAVIDAEKSNALSPPQNFLKLAKKFALEGAILPIEKQMPIEDRSIKRERMAVLRKQQNIEAIIKKTLGYCTNNDIDQRTDNDWFSRYINLAENVSNKTMQDLWAKILSGELSRAGTFSLKALKIFTEMSIFDAKLLAKACSLSVKDQSKKNIRLISGVYQQPGLLNFFDNNRQQKINLSQFGLNYADLLTLAENHLIFMQESESNLMDSNEKLNFNYNGLPLKLNCIKANSSIQFYKFTPVGAELAQLISDKPNDNFFTVLKQQLSHHFDIE
ncbi:MAG: TIGR03899 family protein [Colwellia sp.]